MTAAGWTDAKTVAHALLDAAVKNGYVAKRGDDAAKKTILSCLNAGALKPRLALAESDHDEPMDLSGLMIDRKPVAAVLEALGIGKPSRRNTRDDGQVSQCGICTIQRGRLSRLS
jgi:hypothetical protein